MTLSIKNREAERLAKRLARKRSVTVTAAVIQALREALADRRRPRVGADVTEAILRISERCAALPDLDPRPPDEILGYDDQGGIS